MELQDVSDNPRIASLTKLMRALDQSRTPFETFHTIRRGLGETYGTITSLMLSTRDLPQGEYRVVLWPLDFDAPLVAAEPWMPGPFALHRGGTLAPILANPQPQIIHNIDWSTDPYFSEMLADYGSLLAIPFSADRLPMNWAILLKRRPEQFTLDDLEQAILRTTLIGSLLESQALAQELGRAKERIDADIRQIGELQRTLLPDPLPSIPGLELAVSYETSGQAGGDIYDFFPLDDRGSRWCIFLGDASGHGPAAAVVMAMVQSILQAYPADMRGPADLLAHANRHLCSKKILGFVTGFLAFYEPATRRLTYASAGHPAPLLKSPGADVLQRLDAVASYPLAIDQANTFKEAVVQLRPGQTLLLYTDGITDARSANGTMFDTERLEAALMHCACRPAAVIKQIAGRLTAHQQGQPRGDDQTLVAMMCV